jgi:hypothetical protein
VILVWRNYSGDYHSYGSPNGRGLSAVYAYAPPPYTNSIHAPPPYTSRIHEPSRQHLLYTSRAHEPFYISRTHEPHAHASQSYHSHRSDLVILCSTSFVCTFTNTTWKLLYINPFIMIACIYRHLMQGMYYLPTMVLALGMFMNQGIDSM